MGQQFRRIGIGAAAGTVAVAGILASGAGNSRAADDPGPVGETLTFGSVAVQSIRLNVGPQVASVGDRLIFSHTLTSAEKTTGLSGVECALTSVTTSKPQGKQKPVTSARSHCIATIVLTDGQIAAQGLTDLVEPAGNFELAVTGGTGRYTGAAGTMRKTGGDKGSYSINLVTG